MRRKYLPLLLVGFILALPGCRTITQPAPFAPSDLTGQTVSSSEINLTWKDNSPDETGFYIYRKTTGKYSRVVVMEANATSHSDNGLSSGTSYSYKVTAYNDGGESESSNEVTITTSGEEVSPSAPSNLAGQAVSSSEIDLDWQDNSTNETGFYIYRKTTDNYSIIATMEANATSYNNTGLSPKISYSYKVTAYNNVGESESSNAINVTTPAEPLQAPSNVMAEAVSYKQINLTWQDNSDDEDTFRIACDMGVGNNQFLVRLPANTTHYEHQNLQPMTEYKYFVIAERGADEACSERFWTTTPCPVSAVTYSKWHLSETLVQIYGQVWSSASEPCRAEVTGYIYNYSNWDLIGTGKETFELGAGGVKFFDIEVEIPTGHAAVHANAVVTGVEIQY